MALPRQAGRPARPQRQTPAARPPQADPPDEIAPVRDVIARPGILAAPGLSAPFAAAPSTPPSPRRIRLDPAAPVDPGVWSARETGRLLATLLRLRAVARRLAGDDVARRGNEAAPTGIAQWLGPDDLIFTAGRGDAYYLAAGGRPDMLLVRPRAGTGDREVGTALRPDDGPCVFETAAPVALASAMGAESMQATDIVVGILGDAGTATGPLGDTFALIARRSLPVLLVGQTPYPNGPVEIDPLVPDSAAGRAAASHGLDTAVADGGNVIAVTEAAGDLIHHVRCHGGGAYLELRVPPPGDPATDPAARLRAGMVRRGDISPGEADALAQRIAAGI